MAVWGSDAASTHPVGFGIASTGFVNKVRGETLLAETVAALSDADYRVVHLDASTWATLDDFHDAIASAFHFPDYYGRNLDALSDCLGDVAEQAYGWDSADTGLVIVIHAFDVFHLVEPRTADTLAELCQGAGRHGALFGNRILTLLTIEDDTFTFDSVPWIEAEFLDSTRTRSSR